ADPVDGGRGVGVDVVGGGGEAERDRGGAALLALIPPCRPRAGPVGRAGAQPGQGQGQFGAGPARAVPVSDRPAGPDQVVEITHPRSPTRAGAGWLAGGNTAAAAAFP